MAELHLKDIAAATAGTILAGDPGLPFRAYGIDSREVAAGALFFALRGARDGHDFVPDAAARGAAGAVVSREVASPRPGFALVRVVDTVKALQDLARSVLAGRRVTVVGITGSTGKTTSKEFAAALLGARFRVLKSEGNLNNHLGLPLSLLRLEPQDEVAVLEMGMSAAGEIRVLTAIAPPDVAVITNIHPVHLEFFAGLEAIALAKKEILDGARPDGVAVLNADDPWVEKIAEDWRGRRMTFGLGARGDVRAAGVRAKGYEGLSFELLYGRKKAVLELPFLAESFLQDFLAAAAVAKAMGLGLAEVRTRAAGLAPLAMRGVLVRLAGDVRLLDDSYNSNPKALEDALRYLVRLPAKRKVAILADMLELGPESAAFHRQAGRLARQVGWDVLVAVGPLAREMAEAAHAEGMPAAAVLTYPDADAAAAASLDLVLDGDLVLVKGSRGMKTEKVVARLKAGRKE
ncbi:MAG: UDP-N-acetylmuramoyl-tripeptide--D-alanyl-D-alanine ligase [Candidatus Aminicenantes bacterium]|nr:UDP-N-acetylmuramoyl-tripeptide--D-alanyl-D-alanine ligase [Candidatus Aminicenantes bacterium]